MHVPELTATVDGGQDHDRRGGHRTAAAPTLIEAFRLRAYLSRLGSRQIRNMGTIGGNIGTASPIGDMLLVLFGAGRA